MRLRESLPKLRPQARVYAETLKALPEDITGLRGEIASLAIGPLKALGLLDTPQLMVKKDGLWMPDGKIGDRMAMLVKESAGEAEGQRFEYVRFSQREEPRLALAIPHYDGKCLSYSAANDSMPPLDIDPEELKPKSGNVVHVKMFSDGGVFPGVLEDGPITEWVRDFLRKNVKNMKVNPDTVHVLLPQEGFTRSTEEMHDCGQNTSTLYTDGGQILVASASTLEWMNAELRKQYGPEFQDLTMDSFRPNIVLEGLPPNVEDIIDELRVHGVRKALQVLFGGMSVRCAVTMVDPKTGLLRKDGEPLVYLKENRPPRPDKPKSTTFASNAVFPSSEEGEMVSARDRVEIVSEKAA